MTATRFSLVPLLLVAFCGSMHSQDKPADKKFTLHSYGDKAQVALEAFGADLGYSVELPHEGDDTGGSVEDPCWFAFKDVSVEQAASVLSFSMGLNVIVDNERRKVSAHSARGNAGRSTKGYDASVLSSRYVDYVNRFGAPKIINPDGKSESERTATEHLLDVLNEVVIKDSWGETGGCCVGQKVLLNLTDAQHTQVREFLALLMNDKGGQSASLTSERATRQALAKAPHTDEYNERPLGSVMGSMFAKSCGFVVSHALASTFSDQHVTRAKQENESVADVLGELALQFEFEWGTMGGLVRLTNRDFAGETGYRVFELKELLDRLATAYAGQRTQPGKKGGFEGDLKSQGGMEVIRKALEAQGESANRSFNACSYGTRLVVSGSAETIDAALAILKEIGFEEPKDD